MKYSQRVNPPKVNSPSPQSSNQFSLPSKPKIVDSQITNEKLNLDHRELRKSTNRFYRLDLHGNRVYLEEHEQKALEEKAKLEKEKDKARA